MQRPRRAQRREPSDSAASISSNQVRDAKTRGLIIPRGRRLASRDSSASRFDFACFASHLFASSYAPRIMTNDSPTPPSSRSDPVTVDAPAPDAVAGPAADGSETPIPTLPRRDFLRVAGAGAGMLL